MRIALLSGIFLISSLVGHSEPTDSIQLQPKEEARIYKLFNKQLDSLQKRMVFETGQIMLANGKVDFTVPEGFKFIQTDQARFILEQLWGNMPDKDVQGMVVKDDFKVTNLVNDYSFVISYSELGHISDNKDVQLNHADLLETLDGNMQISNINRMEQGVNTMSIKGWALVPYFDAYKKAVYWANRIAVNGTEEEILNYNLRLLGRTGVIKINAVATFDQLPAIKNVLPLIITQTRFTEGGRYEDFVAGKDTQSEWTVNELVAGQRNIEHQQIRFISSWKFWLMIGCIALASWFGFSILKTRKLSMASVQ